MQRDFPGGLGIQRNAALAAASSLRLTFSNIYY
jgi:hypothetical protein